MVASKFKREDVNVEDEFKEHIQQFSEKNTFDRREQVTTCLS